MPKDPDYFRGKTIVITGAASGIGRASALIFAREGANVLCADINGEGAARAAAEVDEAGGHGAGVRVDVTSRPSVEAMVDRAKERFGRVDFQFNSAGGAIRRAEFLEIDDDLWDRTYGLNVKGVFYCMQAVLPEMLKNGKGVIVNMASMAHKRGGPGVDIHYASAKGSVVTMTLGVAREFAARGIRCLSISPGPVDTPFQSILPPELRERSRDNVPMKRFGRPEEIGEMVLFMCSDACEFMTADTVFISGGGGFR
ncbi:MAG: SDR family oxidoreductase [Candidatus Tectomicrobia bacterium]|nr:SDR family oxidoreductase [Candidatus Tectomicrobia bacterium]